jgi:hypothetical protein
MIAASFARLDALQIESDILLAGKELGVMVVEDVQIDANKQGPQTEKNLKGAWAHITNFLDKIIKFIKEALSNFVGGITNSMSSADEWYQENAKYLNPVPPEVLKTLTLTVIPYWETNYATLDNTNFPMQPNKLELVLNQIDAKANVSKEEMYRTFFPDLTKFDANDPRRGALGYYEGTLEKDGTTPAAVAYKGEAAAKAIGNMQAFMGNYKRSITKTQTMVNNNEKDMENLRKKFASNGVSAEGTDYGFDYDL